jgi:hypothetical protein
MIAHIVLFNIRQDVTGDKIRLFAQELTQLLGLVPNLARASVGRSIDIDPGYERSFGDTTYDFTAILEFDHADGLLAYLRHPLHEQIGRKFWEYSESALVLEMELADPRTDDLTRLLVK